MHAEITTLSRQSANILAPADLYMHAITHHRGKLEHIMLASWHVCGADRVCKVSFFGHANGIGKLPLAAEVAGHTNYGEPLWRALKNAGLQLSEPLAFFDRGQFYDAIRACATALGYTDDVLIFTH